MLSLSVEEKALVRIYVAAYMQEVHIAFASSSEATRCRFKLHNLRVKLNRALDKDVDFKDYTLVNRMNDCMVRIERQVGIYTVKVSRAALTEKLERIAERFESDLPTSVAQEEEAAQAFYRRMQRELAEENSAIVAGAPPAAEGAAEGAAVLKVVKNPFYKKGE